MARGRQKHVEKSVTIPSARSFERTCQMSTDRGSRHHGSPVCGSKRLLGPGTPELPSSRSQGLRADPPVVQAALQEGSQVELFRTADDATGVVEWSRLSVGPRIPFNCPPPFATVSAPSARCPATQVSQGLARARLHVLQRPGRTGRTQLGKTPLGPCPCAPAPEIKMGGNMYR